MILVHAGNRVLPPARVRPHIAEARSSVYAWIDRPLQHGHRLARKAHQRAPKAT